MPVEALVAETALDTEDNDANDSDSEATDNSDPLIAAPSGKQW